MLPPPPQEQGPSQPGSCVPPLSAGRAPDRGDVPPASAAGPGAEFLPRFASRQSPAPLAPAGCPQGCLRRGMSSGSLSSLAAAEELAKFRVCFSRHN